jgi:hypothetical protein
VRSFDVHRPARDPCEAKEEASSVIIKRWASPLRNGPKSGINIEYAVPSLSVDRSAGKLAPHNKSLELTARHYTGKFSP